MSRQIKVIIIAGARPNFMKVAPIIKCIRTQAAEPARNGVSVVVMPGDVASADAVEAPTMGNVSTLAPAHVPHPQQVSALADLINEAK